MGEAERDVTQEKRLPEGFLLVRFDQLLALLVGTIGVVWSIVGQPHQEYTTYILGPLVLVLAVSSFVARRRVRKFVKEHGEIEIRITFSPEVTRPRKNILFREVAGLIDEAVDRALDGKGQRHR